MATLQFHPYSLTDSIEVVCMLFAENTLINSKSMIQLGTEQGLGS